VATIAWLSSGGKTSLPSVSFATYTVRVLRRSVSPSFLTISSVMRATDMVLSTVTLAQDAFLFTQKVRTLGDATTVVPAPDAIC